MIMLTYCMCHTIIILQTRSRGKAKTMSVSTDAQCWWGATQWHFLLRVWTSGRDLEQWEWDEPPGLTLAAPRPPRQQTAELTSAVPLGHDAISLGVWVTWLNDSFWAWNHTKIYRYVRFYTIKKWPLKFLRYPKFICLFSTFAPKMWWKFTMNSS